MFRRALTSALAIVLLVNAPSGASEVRTWTDASGNFQVEAKFIALESGVVTLKKQSGDPIDVKLEQLSETDQLYVRRIVRKETPDQSGTTTSSAHKERSNSVSFDIPEDLQPRTANATAPGKSPDATSSDLRSLVQVVVVTGVGVNAEMALQNAFSRAIEQAVGVLVDAETRIKNDEIISDELLTHSRGFVEEHDVLKRWEQDDLHHAQIRAVVAAQKLVGSLDANNIAMREVEGERMELQLKHEVASEKDAAEMFARIMEDYTIENLFQVEILEEPKVIEKDAVSAKLQVSLRLTPDWDNWAQLRERLGPLLDHIASKQSAFSTILTNESTRPMNRARRVALETEVAQNLQRRLSEGERKPPVGAMRLDDPAIALLRSRSVSGGVTSWDIFRVPDSTGGIAEVLVRINDLQHQVRVRLLNADEQPVAEERMRLAEFSSGDSCILGQEAAHSKLSHSGVQAYWLAPLFWYARRYRFEYEPCEVSIRVELDRLDEVASCAAFAEIYER